MRIHQRIGLFFAVALITGYVTPAWSQSETTDGFARIVINDNIGASGSRAFASPFDAVVSLSFGGGSYCTGTLIAPNVVLTARHCDAFVGDGIDFGTDSAMPDFSTTVGSVITPAGNGSLLDGGDLQILILDTNVPTSVATPMRLTDETTSLVGQEATLIGYGFNGLGSQGHNFTSDDMRWGGMNIIDRYGSPVDSNGANIFSADFDDGTADNNTIPGSDLVALAFEATTAPGDSGGPLLVNFEGEWVIAGVLSGGTTATSVYGDISWWTGVAPFRSDIEAAGGTFWVSSVPEPNALALLLVVCFSGISLRRRRK